jgi:L-alanine-DL-glutamate epimerase-like enolase superfamily enzyme
MRITAVDVTPYALPFERPYVTARGRLERREMVLVELHTDEGVVGLGEAVPLSLRGGPSLGTIERELREDWTAWLADRDVDATELGSAKLPAGPSPPSRAAIEMALIDAAARLAGVPAWRLLGAKAQRPIECNATLAAGPPTTVAERAAGWLGRGFETLKLKVGVAGDVEQVAAVRSAVGPEARIRVDANGVWSPPEAIERLTTMEHHGIQLAEQPAADLEGLAAVRARTAIPIAADESVATADDARRAVELGSCQLATVKLAKVGGIGPALEIDARLPVYLSSALDGPVGIAAAATAAQVLSREGIRAQLAHGLATQLLFEDTIASQACRVRDGRLHLPDGHGLGVEIDAEALERHRL